MVTVVDVLSWIRPGYYMALVDLTKTFFAFPLIDSAHRFMRFRWWCVTYEYLAIIFGLGPSTGVFTKMLWVVLRFLKDAFGIMVVADINDLLIQAADAATCRRHAKIVGLVLHCVGYGINFTSPALTVDHLGFSWDSGTMTLSIPQEKVMKIKEHTQQMLKVAIPLPTSYTSC